MRFRGILLLILLSPVFLSTFEESSAALESPYVQEFRVPTSNSGPFAIDIDFAGNVWFTESNASKIAVFFPVNMTFKEYEIPHFGKNLYGLTIDQAKNIWFTGWDTNSITMLDPRTGGFTEYQVPTNDSTPAQVLTDSEGNVWFTEFQGNKIGKLTPIGEIIEYSPPTPDTGPFGITLDSYGNLWFTEAYAGKIAKLDKSSLKITEYVPPFRLFSPVGIAVDQEGIVWFAEHGGNGIGKLNPTTAAWSKYSTSPPPPEVSLVSIPNDLKVSYDGSIWFAEHGGNKIGRFNPKQETFTEYLIPSSYATTLWLAQDKNGDVWFTEWNQSKIGMVKASIPSPFLITTDKRRITLNPGESTNITVTLVFTENLSASVNLSLNPDITKLTTTLGLTASFVSRQLSKNNEKTELVLWASSDIEPGVFNITLSGDDGKLWEGLVITIRVISSQGNANQILLVATGIGAISVLTTVLVWRYRIRKWKRKKQRSSKRLKPH